MEDPWDFSDGEAEYRRALELDPSDATAHQWFSQAIAYIGGRAQESTDKALGPINSICSRQSSPLPNPRLTNDRQFDKAIEVNNKVTAIIPRFSAPHLGLAYPYWGEHKYQQAIQESQTYARLAGDKTYAEYAAALGFRLSLWRMA